MTKTKILLYQDDDLLKAIYRDLSKFFVNFKPVLETYKLLDLGEFTTEDFKEIVSGGATQIVSRYRKALNDQLDSTGVKNAILRNVVLNGTDVPISNFLQAVNVFLKTDLTPSPYGLDKDRQAFLAIEQLSFSSGELFISNENRERILEAKCRLYVQSENDHLVYEAALKMQSGLQEFRDALFQLGLPMELRDLTSGPGYLVDRHIAEFFTCGEDKKVEIKAEAIKGAATYKTNMERMQKAYNKTK